MLPARHDGNDRLRTHRKVAIVPAFLLVLAASCTSEPERRDLPDVDIDVPADASTGGAAPTVPSDVAGLPGRLAVLVAAGNLVTVNPDGSDEVVLAEIEPGRSQVRQPTWSPDGRRVAWVHLEATEEAVSAVVASSGGEGSRTTEAATAVVPFFLSWDPTSSRIAYLGSSGPAEIELGIVEDDGRAGTRSTPANRSSSRGRRTAISCSCTSARIDSSGSAWTAR